MARVRRVAPNSSTPPSARDPYAASQNALIVVSAGNDGRDLDQTAASSLRCRRLLQCQPSRVPRRSCRRVLTIAATAPIGWAIDPSGNLDYLASYSNYGQSAIDSPARAVTRPIRANENCTVAGSRARAGCSTWSSAPAATASRCRAADFRSYSWAARHQHGRAARLRRGGADHRQARRRDGAGRSRADPARVLRRSGQAGQRQRVRRWPRQRVARPCSTDRQHRFIVPTRRPPRRAAVCLPCQNGADEPQRRRPEGRSRSLARRDRHARVVARCASPPAGGRSRPTEARRQRAPRRRRQRLRDRHAGAPAARCCRD